MAQYNRLIAFDYGTKRIGSAYGQAITGQARPLEPIKNSDQGPHWQTIENLIKKWGPEALIVGLPLNMDGTEQNTSSLAREFAEQLARFKLPVHLIDERLSTTAAKEALFEEGGYRALQKQSVDCMAAKIILESWISQNR